MGDVGQVMQQKGLQSVHSVCNVHHMQIPDTSRARLLDLMLKDRTGEGASEAITRLRDEGKTWGEVSDYLADQADVRVGREGLRQWAKADDLAAA